MGEVIIIQLEILIIIHKFTKQKIGDTHLSIDIIKVYHVPPENLVEITHESKVFFMHSWLTGLSFIEWFPPRFPLFYENLLCCMLVSKSTRMLARVTASGCSTLRMEHSSAASWTLPSLQPWTHIQTNEQFLCSFQKLLLGYRRELLQVFNSLDLWQTRDSFSSDVNVQNVDSHFASV